MNLTSKYKMNEYIIIEYDLGINRIEEGNDSLVRKMMDGLEKICINQNGLTLGVSSSQQGFTFINSSDSLKRVETTRCAIKERDYLVGPAYVHHRVDLIDGRLSTTVTFQTGQNVKDLISNLDQRYGTGKKTEKIVKVSE